MTTKKTAQESIDVGASKAASFIFGSLDRRLIKPTAFLVRFSGWILVALVTYITIIENFPGKERHDLYFWICFYIGYLLFLELIRKFSSEVYETSWFRSIRVVANLLFVSALVSIAPTDRHLLIFAYTVPVFAAIVYSGENIWIKAGVFLLALFGIYGGQVIFANSPKLIPFHFLMYAVILAGSTVGFEVVRRKVDLIPSRLTELARELHNTLDLQQLMAEIIANAVGITLAQRGLIIIINPRTKRYVGHVLHNFNLKSDCSIESLAKKCFVLAQGHAFENPDIVSAFNNKSIYHEFFDSQPRSVMAEPLFNRAGQVIGVINVAHNNPNGFEKISRSLLKEFSFLVGNALENCFEHREIKLREARSKEAGEKFVSAESEDEAVNILIEETRQQIPHALKLTLHQYLSKDGGLLPIHSDSLDITPNKFLWSSPKPRTLKPDLRLGYGIAGHALEGRDTILVSDVDQHPWYVQMESIRNIKSLLVAPLFDLEDNELYGTLSLESDKPFAFNLEDESTLTFLSTQASRAIAKLRDFQAWREQARTEQSEVITVILDEVRKFPLDENEGLLCRKITESATRLLGFRLARIRLFDPKTKKLVSYGISGVSKHVEENLFEEKIPFDAIEPFLIDKYRVGELYLIPHDLPEWKKVVEKYFYVYPKSLQKKTGWRAYDALLAPMYGLSNDLIGILTLDLPKDGVTPKQQVIEAIGVYVNAAAWTIELSRAMYRISEQRKRTDSFIDTLSTKLAMSKDFNSIGEIAVQIGSNLFSVEGCSLFVVEGNMIELAHSSFLSGSPYIGKRKLVSTNPWCGLTSWVAATGEVICRNNYEYRSHPSWAGENQHLQYLPSRECRSLLIVPINDSKNNILGVLSLENKKTSAGQKDFDQDDIDRAVNLAGEIGKAMEFLILSESLIKWEFTGIEDDMHELLNWYRFGVVADLDRLSSLLLDHKFEESTNTIPDVLRHAHVFADALKSLHTLYASKSLESVQLQGALTRVIEQWQKLVNLGVDKKLPIHLSCPKDIKLPNSVQNMLVRIATEALSNSIKHSGILKNSGIIIRIKVRAAGNRIVMMISDNGCGNENMREGYGISRMKQLTTQLNKRGKGTAMFDINSKSKKGTNVKVDVVLDKKEIDN